MEHLRELLSNAAKLTELELQLPQMKDQYEELKDSLSDLKNERDWARLAARNLEEPGFFLRLFGKAEEKLEKAQSEARQAAADYEDAKREFDALEYQLHNLQDKSAALSGSREAYDHARDTFLHSADEDTVQQLRMLEIDAFRPVAIETVQQIRKALLAARGWMSKEITPRRYSHQNRRMEFIQLADDYAEVLQSLLVYFPEDSVTLGASMSAPGDYIRSVSMNLSQIDLINIAIEQSLRVQKQLEVL